MRSFFLLLNEHVKNEKFSKLPISKNEMIEVWLVDFDGNATQFDLLKASMLLILQILEVRDYCYPKIYFRCFITYAFCQIKKGFIF